MNQKKNRPLKPMVVDYSNGNPLFQVTSKRTKIVYLFDSDEAAEALHMRLKDTIKEPYKK